MRFLGVHGILNSADSKDSFTDKLLRGLADHGHEVVDVPIPFFTPWDAYYDDEIEERAKIILSYHEPGDSIVAHSGGALYTRRSMYLGARYSDVFLFAPAMESDVVFPPEAAEQIFIFCSKDDTALGLGELLPGHPFGDMGLRGYDGPEDWRVHNVTAKDWDLGIELDHLDHVREKYYARWLNFVLQTRRSTTPDRP